MNVKNRMMLRIWAPVGVVLLLSFGAAFFLVEPAPPSSLRMATGSVGGAYARTGAEYKKRLAAEGIELELITTAGSIENLRLLLNGEVDLALIQGGLLQSDDPEEAALEALAEYGGPMNSAAANSDDPDEPRAIATIANEPLWLFTRSEGLLGDKLRRIGDLKGKKVGIGPDGSGTQPAALALLRASGIDETEATFLSLTFDESRQQLEAGEIDAAFFISSPQGEVIKELVRADGIRPFNFRRYAAYARKLPYVKHLVIPEGLVDLERNIPAEELSILATTTSLCARESLHPAVAGLLVRIAEKEHRGRGLVQEEGEFPTPKRAPFPLHEAADDYFTHGPSWMSRNLPFWAVNLLNQLKVFLIPLIGLAFPLFKIAPVAYKWGMSRRIYKWYKILAKIEKEIDDMNDPEALNRAGAQIEELADQVAEVDVPFMYQKEVYNLRLHIDLMRREIAEKRARVTQAG